MDDVLDDDVEEHDIDALHRAVLREQKEPTEGKEPIPVWMILAGLVLLVWGGWYLGRYDAKFDTTRIDGHLPQTTQVAATSSGAPASKPGPQEGGGGGVAAAPAPEEPVDLRAMGETIYGARCAACHQGSGQGMPNVAPPLDGSEWVTGDTERLIKVVLHGLSGPIEVKGEPFNGAMPGWGTSMSDEEIAAALTYVRSAWANEGEPVAPEDVQAIRDGVQRSTPWTASEL